MLSNLCPHTTVIFLHLQYYT